MRIAMGYILYDYGFKGKLCFLLTGLFNILQGTHEKTKSQEWLGRKEAHLTGHIGDLEPIEESEQKAVEDSKCSGSLSLADLTGIFTQGDIPTIVEFVLDRPVSPDEFEEALRASLLWGETRETVHDLLGTFESMLKAAAHAKHLTDARPGRSQEVVEFGGGDQRALLNATMTSIGRLRRAPVAAIEWRFAEKEAQVLCERGLIPFGEEQIRSS